MTWVKLDDGFYEHPKIERAGGDAGWLYVCAIAYSSRNQTDGFVPDAKVGRLTDRKAVDKLTVSLMTNGLWHGPGETCDSDVCPAHYRHVPADGFVIHDYWGYQPTKAEAVQRQDDLRTKRSEAGRLGAHMRWHSENPRHDCEHCNPMANGMANAMANGMASDSPDPTRPDPTRTRSKPLAAQLTTTEIGACLSSSDLDQVIHVLARVAYGRAKGRKAIKDSETGWLNGTRRNIEHEQGERICELLDSGLGVVECLDKLVGDQTMVRWAMRQEGLGAVAS